MRGMSFCLCHLSITCYIMGDLHSAATGLAKASVFNKRGKGDRCYIPSVHNCARSLFQTGGRVLRSSK